MTNFNNDNFAIIRKECREMIVDYLEEKNTFYLCDMHNNIFNTEERYIYYADAKDFFRKNNKNFDVFDTIEKIVNYEKNEFGEVNTDFSNPCEIINMLYYIIGEEEVADMFYDCEDFDNFWNEEIEENECKALLVWLKDNERV